MTALFLQCRLDSTRLPRKALKPLGGIPLIERVMEALLPVQAAPRVLLTTEDSAEELAPLAQRQGFELFTGPKEDVLARFLKAAAFYGADQIIRATGDNPFVSALLANRLLEDHLRKNADYSGYVGMPLGTGVEILRTEALIRADEETDKAFDHEHVAPYLYNHPDRFVINRPDISGEYGFGREKISVDTAEDLALAETILRDTGGAFPLEVDILVDWLRRNISL